MTEKHGVIYILTNPSFPDWVKIGYADDIKQRLEQLNRSECTPFGFRVYATYEVDARLADLPIHSIIDSLRPGLRSIDQINGKQRKREFYNMEPEAAYRILEAVALINNRTDKLKKYIASEEEIREESAAREIEVENRTRSGNFTFTEWQIPVGATLHYCYDESITCKVYDDRRVEYNGEIMYLTGLAKMLLGKSTGIAGPRYFKYKGAWLWEIENRKE